MASTSEGITQSAAISSSDLAPENQEVRGAFHEVAPSASTSASKPMKRPSYDVFINHRGPDVKSTLATALYGILTGMALSVFLDAPELEYGDFLPRTIEAAMTSALIHIAIFSPRYAESPWCLAELSFMLKSGTRIVPIFYQVDPNDLRWVEKGKGKYAQAFMEHEQKGRYSLELLQEWKRALHIVSCYSGEVINNINDEWKLLKKITSIVSQEINVPFKVAKHPVGLEEIVRDFEINTQQSVENNQGVQIVGIWGMAGSGKTTLAKELYNRRSLSMERRSFVFDVRDGAAKLQKKQIQLLNDLGVNMNNVTFDNIEQGNGILTRHLRSVRLFIVLDDVDNVDQLDALLPVKDKLGGGSFIIVTTRNYEVLISWGISSVYKMRALDPFHAEQLFCWHAFRQIFPLNGFEDLVKKFVKACEGLPLSLEVFGEQVNGKYGKEHWVSQLNKNSRLLPDAIKGKLKLSYDALDFEEREVFLDTTCFFIGEDKSLAIEIWNSLGWSGLSCWERLMHECLVDLDNNNCIKMHNHLINLGREIANERSPYRIWSHQQITDVDKQTEKRNRIQGIKAVPGIGDWRSYGEELRANISRGIMLLAPSLVGLKIFVTGGDYFNQVISEASRELLWLRWFEIGQKNFPAQLSLKNLRVLELYEDFQGAHHLEELWEADSDAPMQLRELFIFECHKFQGLPSSIAHLSYLKKIVIKGGYKLGSLPEEFCSLKSLEHLQLQSCGMLSSLPSSFGDLRNLLYLDLSECCKLTMLPVSFRKLMLLQYLNLEECEQLILMSEDFEKITKLEHLNLSQCKQLEKLPRHITNQAFLRELYLNGLKRLRELPNDIGHLRKLRKMRIESDLLTSLPNSLGDLCSLTDLSIQDCPHLEHLPNTIGKLSVLTDLSIQKCLSLKFLPNFLGDLHSLINLSIQDCPKLECLPNSLGDLCSLTDFSIKKCSIMEYLPNSLGRLSSLIDLSIQDCPNLKYLPNFLGDLSSLTRLSIQNCSSMENLPNSLGNLSSLTDLSIQDCPNFKSLPNSLGDLSSLTCLSIQNCPSLEYLPNSLGRLSSLTSLSAQDCSNLKYLPNFLGDLSSLIGLSIQNCSSMENLPNSLGHLSSLADLSIGDCPNFKSLQNSLGDLPSLTRLSIQKCPSLEYLPNSLGRLSSLTDLSIQDCSNLKFLPNSLGDLSLLISLSIQKCPTLEHLPNSLGDLSSLIELSILNCSNIKCLPNTIRNLSSLRSLSIQECSNLKNLPNTLENLSFLTDLSIQDCPNLESLPSPS
ncbi:hypothetical protein SUGI_0675120 [Cryptomeria japonica]|uniref:disease resistance protein RPV1 isoform X1 n=1 Tax=Cryptomeria japonica TaxID=3369 RepID=UPI0024149A2F|nr:disease resistance protein RPV1 isoform X1 [Cryptomeria japonica]XP_057836198.2 disease resistance protein RPV1 isoform X1 [Cryptomeria japonica]GLJ33575.1 hypothetical protein SUGI_0675120 [Cryptomeria japonica]